MSDPLSDIRLSISTRLALWFGLSFLILLGVFVAVLYAGFHVSLHRDFQNELDRARTSALDRIEVGEESADFTSAGFLSSGTYDITGSGGTYVRLLSADGRILRRSANLYAGAFPPRIPGHGELTTTEHVWRDAPARSVYTPLTGARGYPVAWLEVTRIESALHNQLHRLEWLLAVAVLFGSAVAVGAGYFLARRALRPVARITDASRRIQAEDLNRRIPSDFGARDELTDLADTLNALLDRLSASFERERRFRADAAHEMFTPLSAIQSEIDVTLRRDRAEVEYRQSLAAVRQHARRLHDIVEGLLELSRAEAIESRSAAAVEAGSIITSVMDQFEPGAAAQSVKLERRLEADVLLKIDPVDLRTIVSNLLDNAIKYTPSEGTVTVALMNLGDYADISVSDSGSGFLPEEGRHLFDRFYRTEHASSSGRRGSGLGLSIVKAIAEAYGGMISGESEGPDRGSTFRISLPST